MSLVLNNFLCTGTQVPEVCQILWNCALVRMNLHLHLLDFRASVKCCYLWLYRKVNFKLYSFQIYQLWNKIGYQYFLNSFHQKKEMWQFSYWKCLWGLFIWNCGKIMLLLIRSAANQFRFSRGQETLYPKGSKGVICTFHLSASKLYATP
jgi:hypothetical protein